MSTSHDRLLGHGWSIGRLGRKRPMAPCGAGVFFGIVGLPGGTASPRFDSDTLDSAEVRVAGYQREIILLSVGGNPNVIFRYRASL